MIDETINESSQENIVIMQGRVRHSSLVNSEDNNNHDNLDDAYIESPLLLQSSKKKKRSSGSSKKFLRIILFVFLLMLTVQKSCLVRAEGKGEGEGEGERDEGEEANEEQNNEKRGEEENKENDGNEDDLMGDNAFDGVSLMPVSCINYNNGHMIKFQLFENNSNYQCHLKNLGTFVVSVAHYMRAYFNYQALEKGRDFTLPTDVGYLNCVLLQATAYANTKLYAKIGCMSRETFTSTKLQLHLYRDRQCTYPYIDSNTDHYHSTSGYEVNGYLMSSKVSFRPPFYSCQSCKVEQVSDSFNKKYYWYDDDYINNEKNNNDNGDDADEEEEEEEGDDGEDAEDDDYMYHNDDVYNFTYTVDDDKYKVDDAYWAANDDGAANDDFYAYNENNYNQKQNQQGGGQNGGGRRGLKALPLELYASESDLKAYEEDFWSEVTEISMRRLSQDYENWNMCSRVYKYGMWCDEECRALDTFRVNQWSHSDIFLLILMCVFMSSMMLLIFAKRVKAYEKANVYGDEYETNYPGLPPMAMLLVFILIMTVILILANLKFVNETLVFSVVVCILLFIYMLKLTLFEQRGQHLLHGRHRARVGVHPMNRQLFSG